jgi:hypothetical protein
MPGVKGTSTPSANRPNIAVLAALFLIIAAGLAVAFTVGGGMVKQSMAERQGFEPSVKTLRRMSPPGFTPYGEKPKPGEVRPPIQPSGD